MLDESAIRILTFPRRRIDNGYRARERPIQELDWRGVGVSVDSLNKEAGSDSCLSKNINFCKRQGAAMDERNPVTPTASLEVCDTCEKNRLLDKAVEDTTPLEDRCTSGKARE